VTAAPCCLPNLISLNYFTHVNSPLYVNLIFLLINLLSILFYIGKFGKKIPLFINIDNIKKKPIIVLSGGKTSGDRWE